MSAPRTALVTGAAGGLGRVFCEALLSHGYRVIGLDLAPATLAAPEYRHVVSDVTDPACRKDIAAAVDSGGLDVLVNNAGIFPVIPFEETTTEQWRRIFSINVEGMFHVTQASLPYLKASAAGRIVNIASAVVWLGPPGMVAYTASKGGVIGFTRALSSELGPAGVTVNAITPSMIATETAIRTGVTADLERVVSGQSVPRAQQPEDLISTLLFLVDPGSGFVTGSAVNVDGGHAKH